VSETGGQIFAPGLAFGRPSLGSLIVRTVQVVHAEIARAELARWGRSFAFQCRLVDDTGELDLVFLGRRHVGGMYRGQWIEAEGTPFRHRGDLVMMNPVYTLLSTTSV